MDFISQPNDRHFYFVDDIYKCFILFEYGRKDGVGGEYQFGYKHAKENQPCLNHIPVGILVLVRCMALRDNQLRMVTVTSVVVMDLVL